MIISSLRRHTFLVSFLLSQGSPLFLTTSSAMEPQEKSIVTPARKQRACLWDGLALFEDPRTVVGTEQWDQVGHIFTQLREAGAIVPIKYLQHMRLD